MPQHKDDDLRIFQNLYAVAIGIGLFRLADGLFDGWMRTINPGPNEDPLPLFWAVAGSAVAVALVPVGIRFYWGVESLSRYLAAERALAKSKKRDPAYCMKAVTLGRYPALLMHAFLVFALCKATVQMFNPAIGGKIVLPLLGIFAALLALNIGFLRSVLPSEAAAAVLDETDLPSDNRDAKMKWIQNNQLFALVSVLVLVGSYVFHVDSHVVVVIVVLILGANSAVDLWSTAEYYVPRH
jgi:hypothetical protein